MTLEVVSPTAALLDSRYLLEGPVGKGGMATVYRAEDTHLGRTVAIKMIHDHDDVLRSADRAHTEKALLASLNHPSLVTLFDAQLEPHRPQYLVMEFVDGPTLSTLMTETQIPPRQLALITQDLAEGLAAVHAAGIVHRDVKPSNVLMTRTGDPDIPWAAKLADFGIACAVDRSRPAGRGMVLGTLAYMAPEQLRDADPGTAVDIFSLGLVVLAALTGGNGYPDLGSGRVAALARVMRPPTIPDAVDGKWRDLLERMTRLDPAERPSALEVARTARELARSDEPAMPAGPVPTLGAASDQGTPTAPTAVLPPAGRRRRWRRWRRILLGAAGLVFAAIVAGSAFLIPPPSEAGRIAPMTSLRTASDTSGHSDTAPDAGDDDQGAPAETVTEPTDDSGEGNQGESEGTQGAGEDNRGKGNNNGEGNGKGKDK
ncbi:serine/threonine-protein kinase [Microbacterium sp. M]|uniref:serine/threonine-protein kinase n=1 Tax=Microbacterium sp. M TaxID=3377125 RepID=UPI0038692758